MIFSQCCVLRLKYSTTFNILTEHNAVGQYVKNPYNIRSVTGTGRRLNE